MITNDKMKSLLGGHKIDTKKILEWFLNDYVTLKTEVMTSNELCMTKNYN